MKADCAKFEETPPSNAGPIPRFVGKPHWPTMPAAPMRPHVCMFLRFDIDGKGAPENINLVFKAPDNLIYRFARSAKRAIKDRRFAIPGDRPDGYKNLYVEIIYIPVGGRQYSIQLKLRNAET